MAAELVRARNAAAMEEVQPAAADLTLTLTLTLIPILPLTQVQLAASDGCESVALLYGALSSSKALA